MTIQPAVESPERFNSLVAETLAPFETIETWPAGKVLFREGMDPEGVYFLHDGERT